MNNTDDIPNDAAPPMQNPPGVYACATSGSTPFFRFVSICRTENGIEVLEALPALKPVDTSNGTYIETDIQTYALQIPCQTVVDGVAITKFSTQYKTRTVPIKKLCAESKNPDEELETRCYNAYVPYSEMVDGISVIRSRLERRTQLVSKSEIQHTLEPLLRSKLYTRDCLNFYNVDGCKLDVDDTLREMEGYVPMIQIADPNHLGPYFSKILKPETRFLLIE